jgi:hypothetical protein
VLTCVTSWRVLHLPIEPAYLLRAVRWCFIVLQQFAFGEQDCL